jgi:hypothetical protein
MVESRCEWHNERAHQLAVGKTQLTVTQGLETSGPYCRARPGGTGGCRASLASAASLRSLRRFCTPLSPPTPLGRTRPQEQYRRDGHNTQALG